MSALGQKQTCAPKRHVCSYPNSGHSIYAFMSTRPKLHRLAIEFGAVPDISDFD